MRAPEAALVRARAKAPLPELLVLHLSSADIECVKHLELCKSLQSLYADSNSIKDLEGVVALRKLWRIDLNANLLRNLHTLASFRALGFLHLERNRLRFDNLVCLRDQHILELRLLGNEALLEGNTIEEYRTKVVALLPNVWILDGHFITTAERQHAIDEFDPFVVDILKQPQTSAGGVGIGRGGHRRVEPHGKFDRSCAQVSSSQRATRSEKVVRRRLVPQRRKRLAQFTLPFRTFKARSHCPPDAENMAGRSAGAPATDAIRSAHPLGCLP
jgi:Leucine-rich repeat (LRR) protein